MLRKLLLSLCLLSSSLLCCSSISIPYCLADAKIDNENRCDNRRPGYCAWISLKMIGKQYHIQALYTIDEERDKLPKIPGDWMDSDGTIYHEMPQCAASLYDIKEQLNRLNVRYVTAAGPESSLELVKDYTSHNIPVVAGVFSNSIYGECPLGNHAIVITGIDAKWVYFVDCNLKDYDCKWEREEFVHYMYWAVAVEIPKNTKTDWTPK